MTTTLPVVFESLRVPGCVQSWREAKAEVSNGLASRSARVVRFALTSRLISGPIPSTGMSVATAARVMNDRGFMVAPVGLARDIRESECTR